MRKGQASLEMVVGLIILLVVAGVVITLVLHFIKPSNLPNPEKQIKVRNFLMECEEYCKDTNSVEFCRHYFDGDWNGNGRKNEIVEVGKYKWKTCENRVYCFLVYDCEDRFGSGRQQIENCRKLLCQTYLDKYGYDDKEDVDKALLDDINFDTRKCSLDSVRGKENWYKDIFVETKCDDMISGGEGPD